MQSFETKFFFKSILWVLYSFSYFYVVKHICCFFYIVGKLQCPLANAKKDTWFSPRDVFFKMYGIKKCC